MQLRSRQLVCQQVVELVTDYLDGALSRRDRRRFEAHLRSCPNCSAYLAQIRSVIDTAGHVEPDDLDPGTLDELTELYRRFRGEPPDEARPDGPNA